MSRWWMRFALLAGSSALGLFGAELFVRAFVSVRDVGPPLTEYDPLCGQRLKRSFRCVRETPDFVMHFSSNSLGWRGPEPATPEAGIVFLGDSFTMGYGVDDGREFPQLLAGAFDTSVVNMGLGGTGHGRWALMLRNEVPAFHPRIVVLQLCSNDAEDDLTEGLASLDARGTLVHHTPCPPSAGRRLQEILAVLPWVGDSHILGLLREFRIQGSRSGASVLPATNSGGLGLALALFEESIGICAEQKWRVVVLSADLSASEASPFGDVCRRRGVPFVRMPSKPEAPELYFAVDGHWNEAGHRRAAELLAPWLR